MLRPDKTWAWRKVVPENLKKCSRVKSPFQYTGYTHNVTKHVTPTITAVYPRVKEFVAFSLNSNPKFAT